TIPRNSMLAPVANMRLRKFICAGYFLGALVVSGFGVNMMPDLEDPIILSLLARVPESVMLVSGSGVNICPDFDEDINALLLSIESLMRFELSALFVCKGPPLGL